MLNNNKIVWLYVIGFILSLHIAIPTYITSTFLSEFIHESLVGLVYTTSAVLAIFLLIFLPRILSKFGNYRISMIVLGLEIAAVFALAITREPIFVVLSAILSLGLIRIATFNTDIFLENYSTDGKTGGIRGVFLSASNFAWVMSPLLAGFLLGLDNYFRLYLTGALVGLPILFIFFSKFRDFQDPIYDHPPFWSTLKEVLQKKNIKRVVITNIMLRFFYAWMVIYTPIYLHEHIGFGWGQIGLIFTIMLVPFILLEIPLGRIADEYLGEKELLVFGFLIMAFSTAYLSFITEANLILWAIALFATRIGASMVEIMSETYFFKKIDGQDSNLLSLFRMTSPFSYIISPLIATAILPFIGIQNIFLVLGIIMIIGLHYSLKLRDTL